MLTRVPSKQTLVWTMVGSSLFIFVFFHQFQNSWKPPSFAGHEYLTYNVEQEEPLDPSQTCQVPRIHPFDPSIIRYLSDAKPIFCKVRQPSITFIDGDGLLLFNDTALQLSGYKKETLSCTYQEIVRVPGSDTKVTLGKPQPLLENGTKLDFDFVSVSCYNFAGISFYANIHAHVAKRIISSSSSSSTRSIHEHKQTPKYNVLVLGIDSLSRLSFIRNLPKTYHFLTHEMGAFVFRGMTKVGDNTFPNLAAILTGKSVYDKELPTVEEGDTYDSWPCIWKNFSRRGYITMFAEDRPDIALFNYLRGGLRDPPTDHYLRPYWLSVESSSVHRLSSHMCYGSLPKHLLQLNYTGDFVVKYSSESDNSAATTASTPFFGFSFFVELSHDYVSQVSVADDDLVRWLRDLFTSGHFNNTFFIFLSDHGHRFDAMRATLVGRIEERMPFFAFYIPPIVLKSQPQVLHHLKQNVGRLTSPYDTYFTLLDVLRHSTEGEILGSFTSGRGTSLFGPISPNRTCASAGIPDHYCTCEEEEVLPTEDLRSQNGARVLLEELNSIIQTRYDNFSICSRLWLDEVRRVDLITPSRKVIVNSRVYFGNLVEDYSASGMMSKLRVIIQTVPGKALFEATLVHRQDDDSMAVLGDISRINKYGDQSWCIDDAILRKFCFCVQQKTTKPTSTRISQS